MSNSPAGAQQHPNNPENETTLPTKYVGLYIRAYKAIRVEYSTDNPYIEKEFLEEAVNRIKMDLENMGCDIDEITIDAHNE